jgi:signal transduction histidine kinase/DNA-binding response OmpR family regulator/DNA-binding LacI/PurR family transcriptional regulator
MRDIFTFLIILSLIFIGACQEDTIEKKYRIGFSQCTTADSWRKNMHEGMTRELSFYPEMTMILTDAEGNNAKQIRQIQEFIDQKVDLIIASPNESEAITPIIEKAYQAGIPVILVDRRITSDKFTAFVGADNYLVGQNAGVYTNTILRGSGNVLEIGSGPNTSPTIGRHTGFLEAIKLNKGIRCVKTFWNEEGYTDTLKQLLTSKPAIDLVFTHNDRMAFEVHQVCDSLKLPKKVRIIGVDGLSDDNEGLDLVQKGKIDATILYPTGGEEAIKLANNILTKQPFQKENTLFTTVVNAENVGIVLAQLKKVKEQQEDIERQALNVQGLNKTYSSQRNRLYFMSILLAFVIVFGAVVLYLFKEKQVSNQQLAAQNQAILEQKNQIERISEQARQANEDKMRFYAYISHEFRTPLSLILTPTEDLLHQKPTEAKEVRSTLQLIQKNANRLLRLVDQLLELRKIDAGKMTLDAQQADLVAFVKDIVSDFSVKAKNQQIDLQFICPFKTLPFWFDAEKLDKVFFNILSNAFKYTPKGGLIHISLFKNLDKIEFVVTDNGIGMTLEEREHAFDLFYRGSQNLSLGSGLGLALSHEFVQLHGGDIRLESEKGHGTTFKIVLPFISQKTASEIPVETTLAPHFNHQIEASETEDRTPQYKTEKNENTIVIIEDNADLNYFLKEKLSKNYNTIATETAERGWEEILSHIPDVIISDVMLPEMDGFALTQKVKSDFRTSHIPVILLTAKGQIDSQIEGTKAGADAYMSKPFNQHLLEERIKGLIENRDRMRRRFANEITNPSDVLKGERKFLIEFEALLEKNLADSTLSVEKLSHELGMSRVQLFRKISALTNKNVSDYIADFKLQKAKSLLKNSDKTIAEIAYEIGFNSPSYFTTFFKQKTNQTPSDWRNG